MTEHLLDGRTALVTGAAKNIGASVAERLGAAGAAVAVNFRSASSADDAAAVVERIVRKGGRARAVRADVSEESEVQAMVAEIERSIGRPDILVNNAAASVAFNAPWHELTASDWDHVCRVNITGAFVCARAVYPWMKEAGGGVIVNMSSVRALLGWPGNLHYTTSKAALIGFTRGLAREVGAEGIRVNALIIGAIETPEEALYGSPREIAETVLPLQSLKRRGHPDDVAGAVTFLVSDDSDFISGQCLTVDGGWAMH
jgi:3-oxoacyl-[acyl-carrier protein] reductase